MNSEQLKDRLREAHAFRAESNYGPAREIMHEILPQIPVDNQPLLATYYNLLAQIERDEGNYESSLSNYQQVLTAREKMNSKQGKAHAIRHMADIYTDTNKLELAKEHYELALKYYEEIDQLHPSEMANALRGFAILQEKLEDFKAALITWEQTKNLYAKIGIVEGVEECQSHIDELTKL